MHQCPKCNGRATAPAPAPGTCSMATATCTKCGHRFPVRSCG